MDYLKVVVSGGIIEVFRMDKAPYMGDKKGKKEEEKDVSWQKDLLSSDPLTKNDAFWESRWKLQHELDERLDRKEERRHQTARDARNKVRRLALSNFGNHSKFITLTFKENITDLDEANALFKKYIQKKLKRHMEKVKPGVKLRYVSVIEFQERGAVHYHMICNLPYTKWETLLKWWHDVCGVGNGSVYIKDIANVDNVGAYLVKYMTKNAGDERLVKKKMYLNSQGLEHPKEYKGRSAELIIETYGLGTKKREVYANHYESEHLGLITYNEYNLNRETYSTKKTS